MDRICGVLSSTWTVIYKFGRRLMHKNQIQSAYVAFSLYILSVHAFSENRSHDLGVDKGEW